ncbi:MAG: lipoprotein [Proteobacteria bacterium]|nr:lipoprotein [Pseudomonadota bacterium]
MRLRQITMLLALCAALAGCGNKGPLVLPDKAPQTQPSQPATTPAQPQDSGKQ